MLSSAQSTKSNQFSSFHSPTMKALELKNEDNLLERKGETGRSPQTAPIVDGLVLILQMNIGDSP